MKNKDKPKPDGKWNHAIVWAEIIALELMLGLGMYFIAVGR